MIVFRTTPPSTAPGRRGVSLSEVLVSLLVLSIGVVSVATLFPLSLLRTIQATQLTNSTQLRHNFEGLTGPRPELINGAGVWLPATAYDLGDLVVAGIGSNQFYECTTAGTSGPTEPAWRQRGQTTTDDTAEWTTRVARNYVVDPLGWNERTEELRTLGQTPNVGSTNVRNTFGRVDLGTPPTLRPLDSQFRIVRHRGGRDLAGVANNPNPSSSTFFPAVNTAADIAARFGAYDTALLPDSWVQQLETSDITSLMGTSVRITNAQSQMIATLDVDADGTVDLRRGLGVEQAILGRITFFDVTGRQTVIRPITQITSPSTGVEEYNWTQTLTTPPGVTWVRARVETYDQRYSWMLAVRRQASGAAYMDLVVFFKRSTLPDDELIHNAHFFTGQSAEFVSTTYPGSNTATNTAGLGDNVSDLRYTALAGLSTVATAGPDGSINTPDDVPGKPLVVIEYNAAIGDASPFLKRGGFICDAQNNRWYRIVSYDEVPNADAAATLLDSRIAGTLGTGRGAIVRLDTPILEDSGSYPTGVTGGTVNPGGAILMRSIIDIYPLQPQLPWEQ